MALPRLAHFQTAVQAKPILQLFAPRARFWQALVASQLAHPDSGLATWVITSPSLLPGLLSRPGSLLSHRLADHVRAVQALRLERVLPPHAQGFWSVMAEPLWHNSLLSWHEHEMAPWQLRGLVHPHVTGWRHLRDVWQTLHQYPGLAPAPLALQAACQLVLQAVPPPWRRHLLDPAPHAPAWHCATLADGR
jgi:hypothetical protein